VIQLDIPAFENFCSHLSIPSRDAGLVPFTLWEPQRIWTRAVAAGLERDVHDFVTLKGGRQIGGTTVADAMALWWLQANEGTQGIMVSDDEDNRDYRRDVLLEMNASLPKEYRLPMRLNNKALAAWPNGSRLSFRYAGKRTGSSLGRSRGMSFAHLDELGGWPDQQAIGSLRASFSKRNPQRLYLSNSTARGIGTPFHDMWKTAEHAVTQRAIFLAWWMLPTNRIETTQTELWERYGRGRLTEDERLWTAAVRKRYGVTITHEQIAWYRWMLVEECENDEVFLAQEFACLPEDAFQAFGEKFIAPALVRKLRLSLARAPQPKGLTYEFLDTLDETAEKGLHRADPLTAPLVIWEEPEPTGVYVVAGHPAYSSSEQAGTYVAQVFRVWPDRMVQVAQYRAEQGAMYQFAWVLLHLCGAYRTLLPAYFILEVGATGYRVLAEIQALERHGYGLSARARGNIQDLLGSVRHYFYYRPDQPFARSAAQEWKTGPNNRPWVLHGLRDTIERGQMEIRSSSLIDGLAAMRQGESGDQDEIAGAAGGSDADVLCTALAVECWLRAAMPDLEGLVAPKERTHEEPVTAEHRLIQHYLGHMLATGRPPR
jgi:hypothetical protein